MVISVMLLGREFYVFYTALVKQSLLVCHSNAGVVKHLVTVNEESL